MRNSTLEIFWLFENTHLFASAGGITSREVKWCTEDASVDLGVDDD